LEQERERAIWHRAAEPHELVRPHVDVRQKLRGERIAHPARHAVARDDDVRGDLRKRAHLVLELDTHVELLRARLQDLQQRAPLDAAEAMAGRTQDLAADVDLDVVPACEARRDLRVGLGVGGREVAERAVAEYDAEPERIARPVALVDDHVVLRRAALDQDPEIQPGRATADAGDLHAATLSVTFAAMKRWLASLILIACGHHNPEAAPSPGAAR